MATYRSLATQYFIPFIRRKVATLVGILLILHSDSRIKCTGALNSRKKQIINEDISLEKIALLAWRGLSTTHLYPALIPGTKDRKHAYNTL
jgi:hypothetical protein